MAAEQRYSFFLFRAQFKSGLPILDALDHDHLADFMKAILTRETIHPNRHRFRNWAAGNMKIIVHDGERYLYGRVGRQRVNKVERYEEMRFNDVSLEISSSVAFIFHERSELTAVEQRGQLTAKDAVNRLAYIFNHAPVAERESRVLKFRQIDEQREAIAQLLRMTKVTEFSAKLSEPNPYTKIAYRKWWKNLNGVTKAKNVDVKWKNEIDGLNVDEESAVAKTIAMSGDSYGSWKAKGRDARNRPAHADSRSQAARFTASSDTEPSVIDFSRIVEERGESERSDENDGTAEPY